MEILTNCPICEKSHFTPFLQSIDYFLTKEEFTIVACSNCGMKFVNPRPEINEMRKYYESPDYISHGGTSNFINFLYKQIRNFSIKNKYKLVKGQATGIRLIDIGCGTGEFIFFCKKNGFDVTGIEPSEKPREFAKGKYHLDVYDELFLDNLVEPKFHIITLWHVLEHTHLLNERMRKIKEILEPNGTVIIAVPNSNCWDARYYGKFWAAFDLPRHLHHFTKETVNFLIQNHGFEIRQIIPMKLDSFYISILSEKYAKGKQNYFRAIRNGIRSNNFAKKNGEDYSSLIFILKLCNG